MPEKQVLDLDLEDLPDVPAHPVGSSGSTRDVIVLNHADLDVEPAIAPINTLTQSVHGFNPVSPRIRGFSSNLSQNIIAGLAGGGLGFLLGELMEWNKHFRDYNQLLLHVMFFCGVIGSSIGLALGTAEGIGAKVKDKAIHGALLGVAIGFVGGCIGGFTGQLLYTFGHGGINGISPEQILIRAVAWMIVGGFTGLGQGIAVGSKRKILNALFGGLAGGFVGGAFFDVTANMFQTDWISRMVAITLLGACTGLAIGLVEQISKQAWLRIQQGPLAGKEFIIYHQVTRLGSSYKCEITIIKDESAQPFHAEISQSGSNYIIKNLPGNTTMVNGRPVNQQRLRNNDIINIGNTVLVFNEKNIK